MPASHPYYYTLPARLEFYPLFRHQGMNLMQDELSGDWRTVTRGLGIGAVARALHWRTWVLPFRCSKNLTGIEDVRWGMVQFSTLAYASRHYLTHKRSATSTTLHYLLYQEWLYTSNGSKVFSEDVGTHADIILMNFALRTNTKYVHPNGLYRVKLIVGEIH